MISLTKYSHILNTKIEEWKKWDRNEHTKKALEKLILDNNVEKLEKIMLKRITFGTAGLRGKMDLGYSCMNDLIIIQTAQGFLKHLEKGKKELLEKNGIVVGYDGRHNSKRWAELTSSIFLHAGYPVRLFGDCTPTPFISFAISQYKCASGVMVTASHNPKEDNGYKVYDSNACQIINPVDKNIHESILQNLEPWECSWDTTILKTSPLISDPLPELFRSYLKLVIGSILPESIDNNEKMGLVFTYSAMHGVGYKYVKKALDGVKIRMEAVGKQRDPDPEFSTVKFPNPEEGESSLDLSFKKADEIGSLFILANDPDADRLAFAEKNKKTGQWKLFSGNELGAIFGWWMLHCQKIRNPNEPMENLYMMSSTVSSMILKTMAKTHGFNFLDTLTGFKWMGNKTIDVSKQNKKVLLGYEVEIGFMCIRDILDKDGVSAAAHMATLCSYVYSQNQQIADKLDEIYSVYGYHVCRNSYFTCSSVKIIKEIFDGIRNFNGTNKYPTGIFNNKYEIISVRDLTTGYDSTKPDKKAVLPLSPEMITFTFDNGLICTLRTSGTEPKIKYYTEICASPDIKDKEGIRKTLDTMVDEILEEFLQPEKHELIRKSD